MISRRDALGAGTLGVVALSSKWLGVPDAARGDVAPDPPTSTGVYVLNQDWLFGGRYLMGAEAPDYSEAAFSSVTLPHIVTPLSWGDWNPSSWEEVWIYRRHVPKSVAAAGRVFVDFEGVMTTATVYLNGVELGQHQGGYLPFSVELTAGLTEDDNVLALTVDATWQQVPPDGASAGPDALGYLEPGGIYRDVFLRLVPDVFISDVFAKATGVLSASPGVEVQVTLDVGNVPDQPVAVSVALMDGTAFVASAAETVAVTSSGLVTTTLTITGFSGVTLWSPDEPKLYQISATVLAGGVAHSVQINTGFREAIFLATAEQSGFYLNGERLEIFGLNRHQLFPFTGMAGCERLQRRDAEILKELNCNMVRCSHYPQSPYFLDACDELGLMVWEEPPGWQYVGGAAFQDIVVQNVTDMVIRDRNRPSVIVWATRLNESANDPELYAQTRQLAYQLDGSRQTTGALDYQNTSEWAEDVYAFDDYHSVNGNATLNPPISGVPYMISEAVGALDGAPLYRWIDSASTLQEQGRMHAQVHNIAQADPDGYAGLLGWAGFDFQVSDGPSKVWHNIRWPGVMDTFRIPKPGAGFYESQVDPNVRPVIVPMFFWDFGPNSPAEGPGQNAMIATNCDTLKLYIDGTLLTSVTPDAHDYGGLAYPPAFADLTVSDPSAASELRIDGYLNGSVITSLHMSADTADDELALTIDDAKIQGDGTDATRFTIRALDGYGNQRPYPSGDVTLAMSGPGTLISDNPFPFAELGGVGGGFIRSLPGTAGTVLITATHPTLGSASASLMVQASSGGPVSPAGSAPRVIGTATAPTESPAPALSGSSAPPSPSTQPTSTAPSSSGSPSPPIAKSPTSTAASKASVRAALAAILVPTGKRARITEILRMSEYTVRFRAPAGGKLTISWYSLSEHRRARSISRQRVLVASQTAHLHAAGPAEVKIRLSRRGRDLLRHAHHQRLTVEASFTPTNQPTISASRAIDLRR